MRCGGGCICQGYPALLSAGCGSAAGPAKQLGVLQRGQRVNHAGPGSLWITLITLNLYQLSRMSLRLASRASLRLASRASPSLSLLRPASAASRNYATPAPTPTKEEQKQRMKELQAKQMKLADKAGRMKQNASVVSTFPGEYQRAQGLTLLD